jgi:hypothetical protein
MDRASCSSGLKQTEARPAKSAALRRGRGSCEWRTGERRLRETCGGAHRRSGRTERPDFGARRTEEMAGLGLRTGGGTLVAEKGQGPAARLRLSAVVLLAASPCSVGR